MPIIPNIGVVFSFTGSLSLDRYHFISYEFEESTNISVSIKSSLRVTDSQGVRPHC